MLISFLLGVFQMFFSDTHETAKGYSFSLLQIEQR